MFFGFEICFSGCTSVTWLTDCLSVDDDLKLQHTLGSTYQSTYREARRITILVQVYRVLRATCGNDPHYLLSVKLLPNCMASATHRLQQFASNTGA